ncbi:MAG: serpin family protein, partial [Eubacteriales bacterium]|nr:serpin family protein [Eubacteriales bacterium]
TPVHLALPVYEAEYEDSLIDDLDRLGMGIAFGESADFSRLNANRSKGLYISEVKHKTVIRVNEKGTEAAAATSVAIDESAPGYEKELIFNRPFLYGIIDLQFGLPLFIGILENPAAD